MSSTYSNKFTPPSHPGLLKRAFGQRSNHKKTVLSPLLRDTSPEGPTLFQDQDYKREESQDSEAVGIMPDKFLRDDDGFPSPFMFKKNNHKVRDNIIFHSHSVEKGKMPHLSHSEQKENVENGASESPTPPLSTASNHYVSRIERLQRRREYKSPAKSIIRDSPNGLSSLSTNNLTLSVSVTPPSATQQTTSANRGRPSPLYISPSNIQQAPSNESSYTPAPQYSPSKLFSPTTSRHIATGPQGGLQFVPNATGQPPTKSLPKKIKQKSDLDEQDLLIDQKVNLVRSQKTKKTRDLDAEMEKVAMSNQSAEKTDGKVARLASLFSSRASMGKSSTSFRRGKKKDTHSPPRRHLLLNKASRSSSVPKISPKTGKTGFAPLNSPVVSRRKSEKNYSDVPDDSPKRQSFSLHRRNRSFSAPKGVSSNDSPTRSAVSGSSSGYVGWPGTQNRSGETVSLPGSSSEDENDIKQKYINDGRKECEKWMNDDHSEIESVGGGNYSVVSKNSETNYPHSNDVQSFMLQSPNTVGNKFSFSSTNSMSIPSNFSDLSKKSTSPNHNGHTNNYALRQNLKDLRHSKQNEKNQYQNGNNGHEGGSRTQNLLPKYLNGNLDRKVKDSKPTSPVEINQTKNSWKFDEISANQSIARQNDKSPGQADERNKPRDQFIDTANSLQRVRSARSEFSLGRGRFLSQATYDSDMNKSLSFEATEKKTEYTASEPITLSEAAIRMNDEIYNGVGHINAGNIKGYRGFLDKTKDVPNLMDDTDSVSTMNSNATSTFSDYGPKKFKKINKDDQSDIFDGLSSVVEDRPSFTGHSFIHHGKQPKQRGEAFVDSSKQELGIRTAAFQNSSPKYYTQFKDKLKKNVDPFPGMNTFESSLDLVNADSESSFSANYSRIDEDICGDLHRYYIQPQLIKRLVRKYRKMCEIDLDEDSKKSFALLEMRSRIMETDIKRGIRRRGGTVVVDDIVLTNYYKASHRVRDAVIVSKAWRDGASPEDVFTAAALTNHQEKAYFIRRQHPINMFDRKEYFEEVLWTDDTDFMLMRCASLGPRQMRGFEMFTLGDCQSILLKLTNEHCTSLRSQYNEASRLQLKAEELMRIEADDGFDDDVMSNAELNYLSSMEIVKSISKKLACAEKSFNLVRDQIEKVVAQYEKLMDVGQESDSSQESTGTSGTESSESDKEKEMLSRRAQRAELKAEIAEREAMMAKLETEKTRQEVERITHEKQKELDEMKKKLEEMETKSMLMSSEYDRRGDNSQYAPLNRLRESTSLHDSRDYQPSEAPSMLLKASSTHLQSQTSKERLKAKFRSRSAQKKRLPISDSTSFEL